MPLRPSPTGHRSSAAHLIPAPRQGQKAAAWLGNAYQSLRTIEASGAVGLPTVLAGLHHNLQPARTPVVNELRFRQVESIVTRYGAIGHDVESVLDGLYALADSSGRASRSFGAARQGELMRALGYVGGSADTAFSERLEANKVTDALTMSLHPASGLGRDLGRGHLRSLDTSTPE